MEDHTLLFSTEKASECERKKKNTQATVVPNICLNYTLVKKKKKKNRL